MHSAPIPTDESTRLAALRSLNVLDSAPEERLDRITRLAARLLDVPICLISLVDADRQWFKSKVGLGAAETPRDVSFCGHAILGDGAFVVQDAFQDERFADNPLVTGEPRVRFYAGHPIAAPDGSRIGTLCVIDHEPRRLGPEQIELLQELGAMAEREIRLTEVAHLLGELDRRALAQQRAERDRQQFFDLSLDLLCITDLDGTLLQVNGSWQRNLGYRESELVGRQFLQIVHPSDRKKTVDEVRFFRAKRNLSAFEIRCCHLDGSYRWILWNVVYAPEADLVYAAGRDITERKEMEDRILASNRELDQFASVASHDLQEPLRKIRSFGGRIRRQDAEQLTPRTRDYLQRMDSAAERMGNLITDLLAYSRASSRGQLSEPVDLNRVLEDACSDLELRLEEKQATIDAESLPTVLGDATQLRLLFQNLLCNALKFQKAGRAARVKIRSQATGEAGLCLVTVADNGIGFSQSYAERIFGIFQRLHTRTEYEGTGIGLAICRKIVERHGGSIAARGEEGAGACFSITLPQEAVVPVDDPKLEPVAPA